MKVQKAFSVGAVLKESYGIIKKDFWKLIGQYALLLAIFFGLYLCAAGNMFLVLFLSSAFSYVSIVFGLAYIGKGTFSYEEIFTGLTFKKFILYFLGSLLASLVILGGYILLVIPGIIIMVQLRFAKYILATEDIMPLPALKKSAKLTKGARWKIFEFMLISLLINIAGLVLLGVGLFFTIPLTLMAFLIVYKKLGARGEVVEAKVI